FFTCLEFRRVLFRSLETPSQRRHWQAPYCQPAVTLIPHFRPFAAEVGSNSRRFAPHFLCTQRSTARSLSLSLLFFFFTWYFPPEINPCWGVQLWLTGMAPCAEGFAGRSEEHTS